MDRIHAEKVATLPLRNEQGSYDEHTMPDLPTSAAVGEYIQTRTAAWRQHLQRREHRRQKSDGGTAVTKPHPQTAAPKPHPQTAAPKPHSQTAAPKSRPQTAAPKSHRRPAGPKSRRHK